VRIIGNCNIKELTVDDGAKTRNEADLLAELIPKSEPREEEPTLSDEELIFTQLPGYVKFTLDEVKVLFIDALVKVAESELISIPKSEGKKSLNTP
jgi:hypothetical protein